MPRANSTRKGGSPAGQARSVKIPRFRQSVARTGQSDGQCSADIGVAESLASSSARRIEIRAAEATGCIGANREQPVGQTRFAEMPDALKPLANRDGHHHRLCLTRNRG
jgi:hypothetical protein